MAIMMEEFLTVEEIATKLKLSEETVKRMLRQKMLPGYKISGSWRVVRQDLEDFLASQKNIQEDKK